MVLHAGHSWWAGMLSGLLTAVACGLVNGVLIAYLNLSSFIVTLGMFAVARSLAQVLSQNHMIYQFGPDEKLFATHRRRHAVRNRQSVHRVARADDRLYDCLPLHHLGTLGVRASAATSRRRA